jgi:hypothetical protein
VTGPWVVQPGHHDLVFTVLTDQGSDLLVGTLDVPSPTAIVPAGGAVPFALSQRPTTDTAVAFFLGMVTAFGMVRFGGLGARLRSRIEPLALTGLARAKAVYLAARAWLAATATRTTARFAGWRGRAQAGLAARRDRLIGELRPRLTIAAPAFSGFATTLARKRSIFAIGLVIYLIAMAILLAGRSVFAHEGHDDGAQPAALAGAGNSPHRLLDGTLFIPKATQRLLNVKTTITKISDAQRTIRVVGQVVPDPGSSGQIHASIRGRLEPVDGRWPRVGDKVEAAQVLASVVPVVNPIDRGIILQQLAQIDHDTGLVQARLRALTAADSSSASPRERDDARAELANLIRRREAIAAVLRDRDTLRAPLLAPSSGVIAASFAVAGQIVDEQQKLFEVVNLKRLWVEAYAYDMSGLGAVTTANAMGPSGNSYRLKFMSRGPQLQKQTIPLYFQIENADADLSVGSLVTVLIGTTGEQPGVILPRSAVVRDTAGQEIVWQHPHPEGFTAVPVRITPIDGETVMVSAGLAPNMRVVVEGADLLNEVR